MTEKNQITFTVSMTIQDATRADVDAALGGQLARFKQPKRVLNVAELPRNTMGKVQKNLLRDQYGDLFAS